MTNTDDRLIWNDAALLQEAQVRPDSELCTDPRAVAQWLSGARSAIDQRLARTGAVLLRGLALRSAADFDACVPHLGDGSMRYEGGASPRAQVHGSVYESTQWPWFFRIPLHNEMSYLRTQPSRVAFFCATPPPVGGSTLVCDMAEAFRRMPAPVRERFQRLGVRYIRHFSGEPGVWVRGIKRLLRDNMRQTWRFAFRTDDRREVERLCEAQGLNWSWTAGDGLRVESVLPATRLHPHTGEPVWFNQTTTMHPNRRALGPVIYPYLRVTCPDASRYPYNVSFGNGEPITARDLDPVYDAIDSVTLAPRWRTGDLMLLDNRWVAHGRGLYLGHRKILVALMQ
jgi:alpha-ketoglutarate-dependent taurine dioxygenase